MTSVEYHRRKNGLSQSALAAKSGLSEMTIQNYEHHGIPGHTSVTPLLNLADELGVTLDELLLEHDAKELTSKDRTRSNSYIDSPRNAVSNYRIAHNLRFQELADRLGVGSRESARVVCRRPTARRKHILTLSGYEKISPEEFLELYLPDDPENSNDDKEDD